jgi:hypothetical protein
MTPKTKEEILKYYEDRPMGKQGIREPIFTKKECLEAMETYASQGVKELVEAYDSYIKILGDEISDLAGLAFAHGWQSRNVELGMQARERVKEELANYKNTPEQNQPK